MYAGGASIVKKRERGNEKRREEKEKVNCWVVKG
jgi:hypothetical protein